MVNGESSDAFGIGVSVIVSAVMIFIMVFCSTNAKEWYRTRDEYEISKSEAQKIANAYKFEIVGEATGDDIVEFMLKYGLEYNYKIYTKHRKNGVTFSLTNIRNELQTSSKYPDMETAILDMFSEDNLTSILSNDLYGNFKVYAVKSEDETATLGYVCVQYISKTEMIKTKTEIESEIKNGLRVNFESNLAASEGV